jgi:hypothetical protein
LISLDKDAFRTLVMKSVTKRGANEDCLKMVAVSTGISPENLKSGAFMAATVKFKAGREGSGKIEVPAERVMIAGHNPQEGATDTSMKIGNVSGASFSIGGKKEAEKKSCFFLLEWLGWCK